jgi:hypothetical protein
MPALTEGAMNTTIVDHLRAGEYDFVDLGSSSGGSIDYCMRRFSARRGLGVDLQAEAVEQIRAQGFEALQADVLEFEFPPASLRFVSMMDFLEHLPDLAGVEAVLSRAKSAARDFLFIRHPSFEDEHYLNAVGLKQFWTDWPGGHTAKLTVADFTGIFQRLGLHNYAIFFREPVKDSEASVMLPLSAPPNQHHYDAAVHGEKPRVVFPRRIYGQIDFLVALRPFQIGEWAETVAFLD